jgi:UDP-glucuronate 4-epimerase
MKILVTGSAGFIGFHTSKKLLNMGYEVVGIDNYNDYYDVELKKARSKILKENSKFSEEVFDIADKDKMNSFFERHKPTHIVNLAAQAGVRYSIENPYTYIEANVCGFMNILEGARAFDIKHLVYASSSSVYGSNTKMPFETTQTTEHPMSLYAATKKSNELMAHAYSNLFNIPTTGLRFFTVYGPWGRPDMALFLFADAINKGEPIKVFNEGKMKRDFTYVDDIVNGLIELLLNNAPTINKDFDTDNPDPSSSAVGPYRIHNIGNSKPVELLNFISVLEDKFEKKAIKNMMPMQPGDVNATWADVSNLSKVTGYKPTTSVEEGVAKFVEWYKDYYKV